MCKPRLLLSHENNEDTKPVTFRASREPSIASFGRRPLPPLHPHLRQRCRRPQTAFHGQPHVLLAVRTASSASEANPNNQGSVMSASFAGSGVCASAASKPERYLRGVEAAKYIVETYNFSCSPKTLAKLRCVGGGPPFRLAGRFPLYPVSELDAWAQSKGRRAVAHGLMRAGRSDTNCDWGLEDDRGS